MLLIVLSALTRESLLIPPPKASHGFLSISLRRKYRVLTMSHSNSSPGGSLPALLICFLTLKGHKAVSLPCESALPRIHVPGSLPLVVSPALSITSFTSWFQSPSRPGNSKSAPCLCIYIFFLLYYFSPYAIPSHTLFPFVYCLFVSCHWSKGFMEVRFLSFFLSFFFFSLIT